MRKCLVLMALMVTGCMSQDDGGGGGGGNTGPRGTLDPVGVWDLDLTFGSGTCGFTTLASSETVLKGPAGYLLENSPGVTDSGTIECTEVACTMRVTETGPMLTVTMTLSLNKEDQISGNGTLTETKPCSQSFTAVGTFAP